MKNFLQRVSAVLVVLASSPVNARACSLDETDRIEAVLARAGTREHASAVTLAHEILDQGTDSVERTFEVLGHELQGRPADMDDIASRSARTDVLLTVCEIAGPARWRPVLDRRLAAAPDSAALAATFAVVDRCGNAQDLALLLQAARADQPGERRRELEGAITTVLLRDAAGFNVLEATLPLDSPDVCKSIVTGVEETNRVRAAELLVRWIEQQKVLRLVCLQHLSRLALTLPKPLPDDLAAGLRTMLERGDSETLPELLVCLGRFEDDASIPTFLRWLKEGEYTVRQNALWALQYTTRLTFREDTKAWNAWWNDETKWWEREATATFAKLRRGTKAEKVAALNAIDMRRTGRHRLAAEVAYALEDADVDVACLAARELANLGSSVPLNELVNALESRTACLVLAAHDALQRITKRTLPTDPQECRAELMLGP